LAVEYIPQLGYLVAIDSSSLDVLYANKLLESDDSSFSDIRENRGDENFDEEDISTKCPFQLIFQQNEIFYLKHAVVKSLDNSLGDLKSNIAERQRVIILQLEEEILEYEYDIIQFSIGLANLDAFISLGEMAIQFKLEPPEMTEEELIVIKGGRHLLQELTVDNFVPNDTLITIEKNVSIITGPNASGKSIYLKQIGLIVYLAHIGSYVPCERAIIGLTDRIFTRIYSEESVSEPNSAFNLDLSQVSKMLNFATRRSLCLIDEFGKGTSPIDGMALLAASIQYFTQEQHKAMTIFTLHFYEIFQYNIFSELSMASINFFRMETIKEIPGETRSNSASLSFDEDEAGRVIPLYRLKYGIEENSEGIGIAAAMGIPLTIVQRAKEVSTALKENKPVVILEKQDILYKLRDKEKALTALFHSVKDWTSSDADEVYNECKRQVAEIKGLLREYESDGFD
jgi:DNA mismatch repair protein MSH5